MIKNYLFDLDGTLINKKIYRDSYPFLVEAFCKKAEITEVEMRTKLIASGIKPLPHGDFDSGDIAKYFGYYDLYYSVLEKYLSTHDVLMDDVEEVLSTLKEKGMTIGVVSNSMRKTINMHLEGAGILKYIDFIYSSEDAGCSKPNDEFWNYFIQDSQVSPAESLFIGDNSIDDVEFPSRFDFGTLLVNNDLIKVLDYLEI